MFTQTGMGNTGAATGAVAAADFGMGSDAGQLVGEACGSTRALAEG
jgi:hypothetical protein